ncbi:uncharacterized protein A4U43_C03F27050 [Asparagus officinalis]|uniref:Uncharacterized protein n=1 Tax=Asparagus officinalis TaxID=4686 RepID=A0A5P1FG48_ASPOF|nr:uncharacterized protein A4U43_C03F27050 [Asparagus officinalis]
MLKHQKLHLRNLLRSLPLHQNKSLRRYQQAFQGVREIIISELKARTLAISSRTDLQRRCTLPLEVVPPLATSLGMVVSDCDAAVWIARAILLRTKKKRTKKRNYRCFKRVYESN